MSEEDMIRIEYQNALDNLISSKLKPTATAIISARQPIVLLFEKLMYKLDKFQKENKRLKEKLHEKNERIVELNKLLGDRE